MGARGGSFLLGSGQVESSALRAFRHDTLCLRSISRSVMPPRWSRRIAARSSIFDGCGMTRAFHQKHLDAVQTSTSVLSKLGFWLAFRLHREALSVRVEVEGLHQTAVAAGGLKLRAA
ncbi:hypothetical protein ACFTXM_18180 [Streptomyces sp. NPDC056930]|uniref:hypothetical protein n=1 Tax=Streptomyces sp. NPDC056930 TaxID=3345967 RepID=UPI0036393991